MKQIAAGLGFAILLVFGIVAPTWAACHTECGQSEGGVCTIEDTICDEPSTVPAPSFGAIAYGRKSGAYGYSYKLGNEAKAESVAMQNWTPLKTSAVGTTLMNEGRLNPICSRSDSAAFMIAEARTVVQRGF